MILPDKYTSLMESYIGISAILLDALGDNSLTVDELWYEFNHKYIKTNKLKYHLLYQKFIYVLDFMYLSSMVSFTGKGEIINENLRINNHKSPRGRNTKH